MKVAREIAVTLLVATGKKNAGSLNDARLLGALQGLADKLDEETAEELLDELEDKKAVKLLNSIVKDPSILEDVEIEAGAPSKGKKKAEPEEEEDEEEDSDEEELDEEDEEEGGDEEELDEEEDEEEDSDEDDDETDETEEDEEEEVKPAKKSKKTATKAKETKGDKKGEKKKGIEKAKGPGVIGSIAEFLEAASESKPVSKDDIVAKLSKRYPDREESSLRSTVNQQVPTKLRSGKGLNVLRGEGGYYIGNGKAKPKAPAKTEKSEKAEKSAKSSKTKKKAKAKA